jgi:uncharacterized membrane protein
MLTCALTGKSLSEAEAMPCSALRPSLLGYIQRLHPGIGNDAWLSREALADLSAGYVEDALQSEMGEITELERQVIESIREHELLAAKPDEEESLARRTFGERLSDGLAAFGGSWRFIIYFGLFLALWIAANSLLWRQQTAPDPYPFILLNLMLSCLAALQAPLIMMSQNRQEARDRERARLDYQINLKAELEIRHLHEKLDHLLRQHSERLLEIQRIQVDMLRQLMSRQP